MAPTDETNQRSAGLDQTKVQAIASRLRELRRRWDQNQGGGDRTSKATEVLDAVLSDLEAAGEDESGPMAAEDVDLGLAMVEEMFEAEGSQSFSRVIASIRASLTPSAVGSGDFEEPPPPIRFQPPPTSAVRRRRPRPHTSDAKASAPAARSKSGFRSLMIVAFIVVVVVGAALFYFKVGEFTTRGSESTVIAVGNRPLISGIPDLEPPREEARPAWAMDEFDDREEEMASLTLEIHLAEEAVAEGDLNSALRHFAAAATIDRHHPRVVVTGKYLIASMLREGDLAHGAGDAEMADRRVQSAHDLARGFGLEGDTPRPDPAEAVFADIDPGEPGALQRVVGYTVRLSLKTGDVVYGHAVAVIGDHLLLDVYAGTRGGKAELSKKILVPTIEEIRIY